MIGRIRGELAEKKSPSLLVDVSGIGYEILAPMTTIYKLPDVGKEVLLHTHFVVREDAQLLYGFISKSDRRLFQELIKVNGVGPKMALAILSGMDGVSLIHCIESQDHGLLVTIPGIGKKTAERLIVEMKDRIEKLAVELMELTTMDGLPQAEMQTALAKEFSMPSGANRKDITEAISALEALGYKNKEAHKSIMGVRLEATGVESLIKLALKSMIKSKA